MNAIVESLWLAGGWLKIPYSAVNRIDPEIWTGFLAAHCDDRAKASAEHGCFARGAIVVGRERAKRAIKGYQKLLKQAKANGIHKIILRARLASLRFETKYFSPKLP